MLGNDYERLAHALAEKFDCRIELPESWSGFFAETGVVSGGPGDRRQFVRHKFRAPAVLEYLDTIPLLPREQGQYLVYLKDISCSGVSLIHHEQLFPMEQMRLLMPEDKIVERLGQRDRIIEVTRCVRAADHCFVVGVRFVEKMRPVQLAGAGVSSP